MWAWLRAKRDSDQMQCDWFHPAALAFFVRVARPEGKVHITKATLQQLDGQFEAEPGNGHQRDQYLADHQVETFLIVPTKLDSALSSDSVPSRLQVPEREARNALAPLLGEVDLRHSFGRVSAKDEQVYGVLQERTSPSPTYLRVHARQELIKITVSKTVKSTQIT
ncbi:hypothetical protein AVEN_256010-1 [Araneus ventricosus]|uniref:Uncharacterized protein n=1 Tax=Araneus ventricosus TaxID=182803 RepID=A0A4Y2S1Y9_ARAVE|nr:hypothetical protein AVEN_256010-1 [Araneus ventricosus]